MTPVRKHRSAYHRQPRLVTKPLQQTKITYDGTGLGPPELLADPMPPYLPSYLTSGFHLAGPVVPAGRSWLENRHESLQFAAVGKGQRPFYPDINVVRSRCKPICRLRLPGGLLGQRQGQELDRADIFRKDSFGLSRWPPITREPLPSRANCAFVHLCIRKALRSPLADSHSPTIPHATAHSLACPLTQG